MPLTIHGELTADGDRVILVAVGPDHEVAHAARTLGTLTPAFRQTDPPGALSCAVSWPALVQLAETFGTAWHPGPALSAWITAEVLRRTELPALTYDIPYGLEPYDWQVTGARMIAATGRALLTDEPGVGKTVAAILGLAELAPLPLVVLCPASVVDHWVDHLRAWAPDWRTIAWRGSGRMRYAKRYDVYVVSFDTARNDVEAGIFGTPAGVVVDELHLIKSPHAKRSVAARKLATKAKVFVGLGGTPITHHSGDLWPTLVCLSPKAWTSRERWVQRYCLTVPGDYDTTILGLNPHTEPEFRTTMLGQHRRVAKADVLADLPPKVYSVRTVDLPPAYRKAYDEMAEDMLARLPDDGGDLEVMSVLAQLTRLSQLACAAADVAYHTELDADGLPREHATVTLKAPSWKVDALLEVLDERQGNDSPVVAFAPSRQLIMLAGAAAERAGYRVGYVVGGQSPKERTAAVEALQAGELDLLCATTGAGGVGLTFTASRTVVFLQRPWSLVEATQAEDRLHRVGAQGHESIDVIDVVARNTIDSRVRGALKGKAGQLAELLQDPRIVAELLGGGNVTKINERRESA